MTVDPPLATTIDDLPDLALFEILDRLEDGELARASAVCRRWRDLVDAEDDRLWGARTLRTRANRPARRPGGQVTWRAAFERAEVPRYLEALAVTRRDAAERFHNRRHALVMARELQREGVAALAEAEVAAAAAAAAAASGGSDDAPAVAVAARRLGLDGTTVHQALVSAAAAAAEAGHRLADLRAALVAADAHLAHAAAADEQAARAMEDTLVGRRAGRAGRRRDGRFARVRAAAARNDYL